MDVDHQTGAPLYERYGLSVQEIAVVKKAMK